MLNNEEFLLWCGRLGLSPGSAGGHCEYPVCRSCGSLREWRVVHNAVNDARSESIN
jgi:hypothetical protein